jgi:hypothetical protein
MKKKFAAFSDFYPFYLSQHQHPVCRALHALGSSLILVLVPVILFTGNWILLLILPIVGYGFAWTGHFFFEKNKPATFAYPLYSFLGDWVMLKDLVTGRIS